MPEPIITARRLSKPINADARPQHNEWQRSNPIRFASDWRGNNHDPELETEVRMLWSPEVLYLRFDCRYHRIFVFDDPRPNGRRDQLWERDVAEAFIQPPDAMAKSKHADFQEISKGGRYRAFYNEFEIAPNSLWLDLDISPSGMAELNSGMRCSVHLDAAQRIWIAELAIPIRALTANFDPGREWRVNFFRVEGQSEPRRYMAWQPTRTPEPDFHVPESFGVLRFEG